MDGAVEKSAMRKIYMRLLPFAILSYVLAYIDRINVSFAGLTMRGDLDMSAAAFRFATGTFFWGYFIFEVPSNVILEKVGARLWIARIMISWGIIAGLTALVTGTMTFTVVRFLLGAAEAGFFPVPVAVLSPTGFPAIIMPASSRACRRAADRGGRRSADIAGTPGSRRHVRAEGLADHVHRRGGPDCGDRNRDVVPDADELKYTNPTTSTGTTAEATWLSEGFSRLFVTSMTAPVASGWSSSGWALHPLENADFSRRTP